MLYSDGSNEATPNEVNNVDEDFAYDEAWEREDDYNVFEENQLDLDNEDLEDYEDGDEFEDMDEADAYVREDFGYFGEMGVNEE